MPRHSRLVILGAGPAGYTAAIYGARAMLEPLVIAGPQPGGQLTITTDVENFPGFDTIQGPELVAKMEQQAKAMGASIERDVILSADLSSRPFRLIGDSGQVYTADALVIATGAQAKWLGLPSEEAFKGYGVSACATCDGFFHRNHRVVVVGGGNSAVEEALFLTNFASEVIVVHRRDSFRAEQILQQRLLANPKVKVRWHTELLEVTGENQKSGVTGAVLRNVLTGQSEQLDAEGVFIAIGHAPATSLFVGQLLMKDGGYLVTEPGSTATGIPGVFAAGDVADNIYRQAVTAAGMGCMAALDAERFLFTNPVAKAA